MKFAAFADVHGNSAALRAVFDDIDRQGITRIVNLGDSLSGPMDPAGTADLLMARNLPTVSGNHDRALIDRPFDKMPLWEAWAHPHLTDAHLAWVASLPATLSWNGVFLCHATPGDDTTNWLDLRGPRHRLEMAGRDHVAAHLGEVSEALVLCAHTHIPRAVLDDIDRRGITRIVNLGDSLSGPMDPAGTADLLMARDLPTVSGNHDRALIDRPFDKMPLWEAWAHPHLTDAHLAWVASLPATLSWNGVFLCHATPGDDTTNWLDLRGPDQRMEMAGRDHVAAHLGEVSEALVLCAHTHIPRAVRIGGQLIANPGSVGCPAYLDDRFSPPFIAETGMGDARYAVFERLDGDWIVSMRSVPYDASEMIARIRALGAESWVEAVETGWITPPV